MSKQGPKSPSRGSRSTSPFGRAPKKTAQYVTNRPPKIVRDARKRATEEAFLDSKPERLQKLLATAGLGSRREIERWIESGRITVNGEVATLGVQASANDVVEIDGKRLRPDKLLGSAHRVLAYHKPTGEICTRNDPEGRKTVFDNLPKVGRGRWVALGRLDINTMGLLLFTTDGELANRYMHPSWSIERRYAVRVLGDVTDEVLKQLREGVELDDGPAKFDTIEDAGGSGANSWYHVSLREGRNREVRRLWEAVGLTVSRLTRIQHGPVALSPRLPRGKFAELEGDLLAQVYRAVDLAAPMKKPDANPRQKTGRRGRY